MNQSITNQLETNLLRRNNSLQPPLSSTVTALAAIDSRKKSDQHILNQILPLKLNKSPSTPSSSTNFFRHHQHFRSNLEPSNSSILTRFYLACPKLDCELFDHQNEWLSIGSCSVQGWRINQEDAHFCLIDFDPLDQIALFGVFDGHNGPEISRYASLTLPELLRNNRYYKLKQYDKALRAVFLEFDGGLLSKKVENDLQSISKQYQLQYGQIVRRQNSFLLAMSTGSTAVVALLSRKDGKIYVANIGDSRCLISLKRKPFPMTIDHKPNERREFTRIMKAGSKVINGRINGGLNLSRAFGDHLLKNNANLSATEQAVIALPDLIVSSNKIRSSKDFMVLACDGIWNCLSNRQVCSIIRKHLKKQDCMQLSRICQTIVSKCISPIRPIDGQIGGDNMTILIVKFKQDLPLPS
ncbi:hypothetical protein NH340_JMT00806 [Sarcoptes scabiei]|nr:hypothetical protein NH340_JMT00806 [Sarcoptes scabiei]